MSPENEVPKSKVSNSILIMSIALAASLIVNFWQLASSSTNPQASAGQKMSITRFMAATDSICPGNIPMDDAKEWIAAVNKSGTMFNNKSIFICKEAVQTMIDERPDYTGIFVRRGMDPDKEIHDIGWVGIPEGSPTLEKAYLLEWQSCTCAPCCGEDTSDYHSYTSF